MKKRLIRRPHAPQPISHETWADGQRLNETKSSLNVLKSLKRQDDIEHLMCENRRKTVGPRNRPALQRNERGPTMMEQDRKDCHYHPDSTMNVARCPTMAAAAERLQKNWRLPL